MNRTPVAFVAALCACVPVLWACAAPPPPRAPEPPALPDLPPAEMASRRMALAVTVDQPAKAAADLEASLKGLGGFISSREVPTAPEGAPRSINLVLSVDVRQADALTTRIKALGSAAGERSQTDDVTAETVALNAKLAGQRGIEERLRAWTEGRDRDCAKLGEVERERAKVVDEIAALVARQRVQESRTQYAAMSVRLSEPPPPAPPPSFGAEVGRAFQQIGSAPCLAARQGAVTLIAWMPAWLVLGLVAGLLIRRRRARDHRRPGAPPAA